MHEPTLKQAFEAAITHGPVLIVAPMETPDHTNTNAPITDNSPLIRAALLATNLGASRLVFNPAERHAAVIYLTTHGCKLEMQQVLQLGAMVPAVGFRWCSLNAGFFCDEIVVWGERLSPWVHAMGQPGDVAHALALQGPMAAEYDAGSSAHQSCVEQLVSHFNANGWTRAAEDLLHGWSLANGATPETRWALTQMLSDGATRLPDIYDLATGTFMATAINARWPAERERLNDTMIAVSAAEHGRLWLAEQTRSLAQDRHAHLDPMVARLRQVALPRLGQDSHAHLDQVDRDILAAKPEDRVNVLLADLQRHMDARAPSEDRNEFGGWLVTTFQPGAVDEAAVICPGGEYESADEFCRRALQLALDRGAFAPRRDQPPMVAPSKPLDTGAPAPSADLAEQAQIAADNLRAAMGHAPNVVK